MTDTNLKQIIFKLNGELDDKRCEITDVMKVLYKKGRRVGFKHGRGVVRGVVHCIGTDRLCFEINVKVDSSGNHMWFNHCQLAELN